MESYHAASRYNSALLEWCGCASVHRISAASAARNIIITVCCVVAASVEVRLCVRAANALMCMPGGGGRAARALCLLLFLVMALAAVEYLFSFIFEASPLRSYLYTPLYNATQPTLKSRDKSSSSWPKRLYESSNPEFKTLKSLLQTKKYINNTVHIASKPNTTTAPAETKKGLETSTPILITKIVDSIKTKTESSIRTESSTENYNVTGNSTTNYCELPANLGPVRVNKTEMDLASIETKFPEVSMGGWYRPPNCTPRHKVAIIIPYRDRQQHLPIFLNHIHPFLMRQQLDYGIFVIEQQGRNSFNRAKLFNVGFVESNRLREGGWQCFVFHDVDLLPMDERNLYTCPRQPRHMSASIDKHNFKLLYEDIFGGVSAMTREQFTRVNGFSNKYWGWGGEDDDMSYRVRKMQYDIARYEMSIARYTMLDHEKQSPNPKRYKLLSQTNKNFQKDGLTSLEYEVVAVAKHRLFTLVSVNIDEDSWWKYFAKLLFGDHR